MTLTAEPAVLLSLGRNGTTITYGLYNAQERGTLFVGAGVKVYEGMIVGENARLEDVVVNVCKKKHATNTRSSGSDDAIKTCSSERNEP